MWFGSAQTQTGICNVSYVVTAVLKIIDLIVVNFIRRPGVQESAAVGVIPFLLKENTGLKGRFFCSFKGDSGLEAPFDGPPFVLEVGYGSGQLRLKTTPFLLIGAKDLDNCL